MQSSDQIIAERQRYIVYRDQVKILYNKTVDCYNEYFAVYGKISESYQINGESGDKGVVAPSCESLKDSYELLINSTIPAINNKIDQLNSQIRRAQEREEEEERRAAEEASRV